ncbi:MAG: thioredoxin-dependent thiol peroxidase [Bacteroidia bacterium]|jgi:peroxiredoxin Q/BCP|nr:thioredoxin-dependent thiol peroxidase [Bacteroidia bacterium]
MESISHLKPGKKAPALKGKDQEGNTVALSDYSGKKVILFFYPRDMTPTCTTQVCNLRDHHTILLKEGYRIIGVSADDHHQHKKFAALNKLPYPLVADPDFKIVKKYGVWGEKVLHGKTFTGIHRTTFIIDEAGIIKHIIPKVKSADHAAQIMELIEQDKE